MRDGSETTLPFLRDETRILHFPSRSRPAQSLFGRGWRCDDLADKQANCDGSRQQLIRTWGERRDLCVTMTMSSPRPPGRILALPCQNSPPQQARTLGRGLKLIYPLRYLGKISMNIFSSSCHSKANLSSSPSHAQSCSSVLIFDLLVLLSQLPDGTYKSLINVMLLTRRHNTDTVAFEWKSSFFSLLLGKDIMHPLYESRTSI